MVTCASAYKDKRRAISRTLTLSLTLSLSIYVARALSLSAAPAPLLRPFKGSKQIMRCFWHSGLLKRALSTFRSIQEEVTNKKNKKER